ncbi:MAG TPA: hypothetical protein VJ385_03880 [Fibrobacteria bacterium]|nr:hypothetical protein [Fibrobacteria bacterium]
MRKSLLAICRLSFLLVGAVPALTPAAWNHFDPGDTAKVPKKFSQTGFYSNMPNKTVTPEAAAFEVNTPLWSDNAVKSRWILLKPGSAKVKFDPDSDYYEYPDGAVFVKLFQHDTIPGNAASRIFWETRVLVNKKTLDSNSMKTFDYWYAFSYKWKPDGSEAYLVSPENGLDTSMTLWVNNKKTFRKWSFPSKNACNQCHRQYEKDMDAFQGRAVLGFYTPQLNRPSVGDTNNQITRLFQKGILAWSKPTPNKAETAKMPKWAKDDDGTASLDLRARAYIAANCSGCHGERGKGTDATPHVTDLNYDFFKLAGGTLTPSMELRNVSVGIFDLEPITLNGKKIEPALIVPGHPEISVLLYRMKHRNRLTPDSVGAFTRDPGQMPPLGVFEEDTVATKMIAQWITSLPEVASIRNGSAGPVAGAPVLHGNILSLHATPGAKVSLMGLDGRKHALTEISEGRYRLPAGLAPGLYLVGAGSRTFKLML